ncbi:hypothetical protein [Streptosporangium sp. G12]
MIGAAILTALIAIAAASLTVMAAMSRRWIHALTAGTCSGVAVLASTWFTVVDRATVWPEHPAGWAALIVLWLLGSTVAGLIFWGVSRTQQEVSR